MINSRNRDPNSKFKTMVNDAQRVHDKMIPKWDENERYYENYTAQEHLPQQMLSQIANANNGSAIELIKSHNKAIYFSVNEIRPKIDKKLSEYTSVQKEIIVESVEPGVNKTAGVIKREIEHTERELEIWERIRLPTILSHLKTGLGWTKMEYAPSADSNKSIGNIRLKEINCRDVMVDPDSTLTGFEDKKYLIHNVWLNKIEAGQFCARFGMDYDHIKRLSTTRRDLPSHDLNNQDKICIRFIEYKEPIIEQPESTQTLHIYKPIEYKHRICIYHDGIGVIWDGDSPYNCFTLSCYYGSKSAFQLYPEGEVRKLIYLQILYNVINSMVLDNGRRNNRDILLVDEETFKQQKVLINQALESGGVIPVKDSFKMDTFKTAGISPEVMQLLGLTKQYLNDAGYIHEAFLGEMPSGNSNVSGRAVSLLQAENRRSLTPADVGIKNGATNETRIMYEIIRKNFNASHYIKSTLNNKKIFVPVNKPMKLQEYNQYLKDQKLDREEFEDDSDVKYIFPVTSDQVDMVNRTIVFINPLYPDSSLLISMTLDFNADRDKQIKRDEAKQLFGMSAIDAQELLTRIEYPNAMEVLARMKEANQMAQLSEQLQQNPGMLDMIMSIFQLEQKGLIKDEDLQIVPQFLMGLIQKQQQDNSKPKKA